MSLRRGGRAEIKQVPTVTVAVNTSDENQDDIIHVGPLPRSETMEASVYKRTIGCDLAYRASARTMTALLRLHMALSRL